MTPLLAFALIAAQPQPRDLYLEAAKLVEASPASALLDWSPELSSELRVKLEAAPSSDKTAIQAKLAAVQPFDGKTQLDVKLAASKALQAPWKLVLRGLALPPAPAPAGPVKERLAEFRAYRRLFKLGVIQAETAAAEGRGAESASNLAACLKFGSAMMGDMPLTRLLGFYSIQEQFRAIDFLLPTISFDGSTLIEQAADAWLEDNGSLETALSGNVAHLREIASAFVGDKSQEVLDAYGIALSPASQARLSDLDRTGRAAVWKGVVDACERRAADAKALLSQPEAAWLAAGPVAESGDLLVDEILAKVAPNPATLLRSEAILRTQIRIVSLMMPVQRRQWMDDQIPSKYDTPVDPLSGKPFKYQALGVASFRIYSEGTSETGLVELVYAGKAAPKAADP